MLGGPCWAALGCDAFSRTMPDNVDLPAVNAWTQFGRLLKVVVGRADSTSCHLPVEPACQSEINDPYLAEQIPWPGGQALPKAP